MISPDIHARIRRLFYAEHWKIGTIAAELSLHHETVRRTVETARFVNTTTRVRPSMLDPHRGFIEQTLAQHPALRATRLFEMLRARGYEGSAVQVRRCVARLRPRPAPEAYLRLTTLPGEQAQVDWGHFGTLRIGRAERPLSCFVMVLSWSRAMWAQFVLDQQMESFLRCHEQAFRTLGGVPRVVLYDNLKSVVLERAGEHIRFHDRLLEFAGHHHYEPRPCAPYRGNEKGRVERRIRDLRDSFFAARTYTSLEDLNAQLARWIEEVAHARKVPGEEPLVVREGLLQERPRLLPLPEHAFPCDLVRTVHSGKTPYVRFDGNDYSIPHTLVRKPLTLVASDAVVRLLDGTTEVARHARSWDRGRQIESDAHIAALARHKREAAVARGRDRLRQSCLNADAFIAALIERRMHLGSQTVRLLRLLDLHGPALVDAALAAALVSGSVNAAAVAHLIDRTLRARGLAPPIAPALPDDARVQDARVQPHSLADYDALLRPPESE